MIWLTQAGVSKIGRENNSYSRAGIKFKGRQSLIAMCGPGALLKLTAKWSDVMHAPLLLQGAVGIGADDLAKRGP